MSSTPPEWSYHLELQEFLHCITHIGFPPVEPPQLLEVSTAAHQHAGHELCILSDHRTQTSDFLQHKLLQLTCLSIHCGRRPTRGRVLLFDHTSPRWTVQLGGHVKTSSPATDARRGRESICRLYSANHGATDPRNNVGKYLPKKASIEPQGFKRCRLQDVSPNPKRNDSQNRPHSRYGVGTTLE